MLSPDSCSSLRLRVDCCISCADCSSKAFVWAISSLLRRIALRVPSSSASVSRFIGRYYGQRVRLEAVIRVTRFGVPLYSPYLDLRMALPPSHAITHASHR